MDSQSTHALVGLELELAHADEVLVDLGQPLLVPVLQVLGEELQLLRHPRQRLRVVLAQLLGRCGTELGGGVDWTRGQEERTGVGVIDAIETRLIGAFTAFTARTLIFSQSLLGVCARSAVLM